MNRITDNISPMALYPCIALLVVFFASFNLYALEQSRYWQSIGPAGAKIASFKSKHDDADIIYTFDLAYDGSTQAIFQSINSGRSWVALPADKTISRGNELQTATNNPAISIIATDPKQTDIVYGEIVVDQFAWGKYIGNTQTLYKSIDGGLSWINIKVPEAKYRGNFIMSPDKSETLYASFLFADGQKVLLSRNAGEDWELLAKPVENAVEYDLRKVYLDPIDADILYANLSVVNEADILMNANRIAKSYDAGNSWQVMNVAPYKPGEIFINAENNQQLLMAYGQGVLRSENGGQDWQLSNAGLNKIGGTLTVVQSDSATALYIADPIFGFYHKSMDAGLHWQALWGKPPVSGKCMKFIVNPVDNQQVICQAYHGLYGSKDAGDHWQALKIADDLDAIYANDGKTIYAYSRESHSETLSKSTDNGLIWKNIDNIINESGEDLTFTGLPTIDPETPAIIYSTAYRKGTTDQFTGLYKSSDGGDSWKLLVSAALEGEVRLIMHPLNSGVLIYSIGQKRYWRSENAGDSWLKTLQPLIRAHDSIALEIEFDPLNLQGLFWLKEGQVQYSADRGVTWYVVDKGLEEAGNGALISASRDMFFASNQGIFKLSRTTKTAFPVVSDCLFQWAEKEYPDVFTSGSSRSQQWDGYTYRYYAKSNTYLGFFYEQEVHIKQPDLSNRIEAVGTVEYYQELGGCQ